MPWMFMLDADYYRYLKWFIWFIMLATNKHSLLSIFRLWKKSCHSCYWFMSEYNVYWISFLLQKGAWRPGCCPWNCQILQRIVRTWLIGIGKCLMIIILMHLSIFNWLFTQHHHYWQPYFPWYRYVNIYSYTYIFCN